MEILFENSYVRNKELAKEIYRYFYFKRTGVVICNVLLAILFVINIVIAIFGEPYNLSVFVFVPLFFAFQVFCYIRQVKTMVVRDKELYNKEITVETIVTDDFIQNTASTGTVNKLEYSNVKNAARTKNMILLHSKANLIYIFRKDTFTKGNENDFIMFLQGKGIKVK